MAVNITNLVLLAAIFLGGAQPATTRAVPSPSSTEINELHVDAPKPRLDTSKAIRRQHELSVASVQRKHDPPAASVQRLDQLMTDTPTTSSEVPVDHPGVPTNAVVGDKVGRSGHQMTSITGGNIPVSNAPTFQIDTTTHQGHVTTTTMTKTAPRRGSQSTNVHSVADARVDVRAGEITSATILAEKTLDVMPTAAVSTPRVTSRGPVSGKVLSTGVSTPRPTSEKVDQVIGDQKHTRENIPANQGFPARSSMLTSGAMATLEKAIVRPTQQATTKSPKWNICAFICGRLGRCPPSCRGRVSGWNR